jgi:hypothetical protein
MSRKTFPLSLFKFFLLVIFLVIAIPLLGLYYFFLPFRFNAHFQHQKEILIELPKFEHANDYTITSHQAEWLTLNESYNFVRFTYQNDIDPQNVKAFYMNYFTSQGWKQSEDRASLKKVVIDYPFLSSPMVSTYRLFLSNQSVFDPDGKNPHQEFMISIQ